MKLNIGCGEDFRPGWLNLDCRPLFPESEDFRCCDVRDLDRQVSDGSVEEMVARNVLEYLSWRELDPVLVLLGRKLRPGGVLFLQVPDLEQVIRACAAGTLPPREAQRALFGDQSYPEATQRSLWGPAEVSRRLALIGLAVERLEQSSGQVLGWGRKV